MSERGRKHTRYVAQLVPHHENDPAMYVHANGDISRRVTTYWSRPKMMRAIRAFVDSRNGSLLSNYDVVVTETKARAR